MPPTLISVAVAVRLGDASGANSNARDHDRYARREFKTHVHITTASGTLGGGLSCRLAKVLGTGANELELFVLSSNDIGDGRTPWPGR